MTQFYEIRVDGYLDAQWQDWFDGLTVTREEDGTTLLFGPVPDQPALYGILRRVRDLGLPLVSVTLLSELTHQPTSKQQRIKSMNTSTTSQRTAALTAGFSLLVMFFVAMFAKFLMVNYANYATTFLILVAVSGIVGELGLCLWLLFKGGRGK